MKLPDVAEWTSDMGEISGFGGSYEAACRAMVLTGFQWLKEHASADPQFHTFKNVTGLIVEDNADAKALTKAMNVAAEHGGGATGAMMQACVQHARCAHKIGWPAYAKMMRERGGAP